MAFTAAIRTLIITLIAMGLSWLVEALNLTDQIDVKAVAEVVASAVIVVGSGLVAYTVNKLGSRWSWINLILSAGRAKSAATFVPNAADTMTVTVTPPGEQTKVTAETGAGANVPAGI